MKKLVLALLLIYPSVALTIGSLQNGVAITDEVDSQIRNTSIPYAVARQGQRTVDDNELVLAFLDMNETVYSLSSKPDLLLTRKSDRSVLGHWPLSTSEICDVSKGCESAWWQGRWSVDELLEEEIRNGYYPPNMGWRHLQPDVSKVDFMGCMQHAPLRYGDIEGDGVNELVVLLPNLYSVDWLIFSTQLHKTIFAAKLDLNDIIAYDALSPELIAPIADAQRYQYWSRSSSEELRASALTKGIRGFAKLYFSDFDDDGTFDIIEWRRLYTSRLVSDPIAGFEYKGELLGHYKRVDGEYKKQLTDTSTIKGWLADKNLTWQKGYPSKSECAGQEGQLIPEMHDPLLNDPEVLQ